MDTDTDSSLNQVLVDRDIYRQLVEDQQTLNALLAYGVDNWEGYSEAMEYLEEVNG